MKVGVAEREREGERVKALEKSTAKEQPPVGYLTFHGSICLAVLVKH